MSSLKEVLARFTLFQKVMNSPEIIERIAYEALMDVSLEGTDAVEFRYSPSFVSELSKLDWSAVLGAFERGLKKAQAECGVRYGLLCIVSREYGIKAADETIAFAIENKQSFTGFDLAGDEAALPNRLFTDSFKAAAKSGMRITIHAGEASGPESVWDAIDLLGAERIGHGITSIRDKELMKRLSKDQILLETCPSSNFITRTVSSWKEHPLPQFLEAGVPVSISTDDPGIFGVSLSEEYKRVKELLALTDADLNRIDRYSVEHSFLKFK